MALRLKAYPGTEIEILCYVDDQTDLAMKGLSQSRAEKIAETLVEKGIEETRLNPKGMGAEKPIASNRTAKGRGINRRIEIRRMN